MKEGYWKITGHEMVIPGVAFLTKECSVCGFTHSLKIPDSYCPQCGSYNHGRYNPTIEEYFNDHRSR